MSALILVVLALVLYYLWDKNKRQQFISNVPQRAIFITGCDTGFGNNLAKRLDCLGCQVFAGCLTSAGATELDYATSSRVKTIIVDITKHDSIETAYNFICNNLPKTGKNWVL